jgi:hypothetical protein
MRVASGIKGTLDLILTRRPKPYAERDLPFEVYIGDGKTMPVGAYFQEHPHPKYIATEARLRDLAVGVRGERAGDIMLLAHNGENARNYENDVGAAACGSGAIFATHCALYDLDNSQKEE